MSEIHMECRELLGLLSDYVDGELDPELCAAIERHMAECNPCQVVVDTLRKTVTLYHELSAETAPLPKEVQERLLRALQQNLTLEEHD